MKLKSGFVVHAIGNEHIVVPVGENTVNFKGIIKLNSSGKLLWDRMQQEFTLDDLVNTLLENYEIDEATAAKHAEAFLQNLINNSIVE